MPLGAGQEARVVSEGASVCETHHNLLAHLQGLGTLQTLLPPKARAHSCQVWRQLTGRLDYLPAHGLSGKPETAGELKNSIRNAPVKAKPIDHRSLRRVPESREDISYKGLPVSGRQRYQGLKEG